VIPDFWKRMPFPASGEYVAGVEHTTVFGERFVVKERRVRGLLRAYLVARWMAFVDDLNTPGADGEIGIQWTVREAAGFEFLKEKTK